MRPQSLALVFFAGIFMFACSGCEDYCSCDKKIINISSSPRESQFTITNEKGEVVRNKVTPATVALLPKKGLRYRSYKITFNKAGYKELTVPIEVSKSGFQDVDVTLEPLDPNYIE